MFDRHTFADRVGALFFEKAEARMDALLAEYGVSHPRDLPRAVAGEIFARAVVETAAANFPTANLELLGHGIRSFAHPAFIPAWDRVRSSTAIHGDAFAMASGVDAAVLLAGFGLPVAPFDFSLGIIEKPSNDIDTVLAMFSRWSSGIVGYNSCDAPFYVLLTDCIRSLRKQVSSHPGLFDVRRLFARTGGSLPADPGRDFTPGLALFARQPGDAISMALLLDPSPSAGSLMLNAGWQVDGKPYGAPNDGYLPIPVQLLRAVAYDPAIAASLSRSVGAPPPIH
jgi:hypothetical protein